VIRGKAPTPSCLSVGSRHLDVRDVHFLWGMDLFKTGKMLRRMYKGAGHRSIWRIGPAGENLSAMACINVDTYRHFGRLGCGAVMGAKNLKGSSSWRWLLPASEGKAYAKLFAEVHRKMTDTDMMEKYHNYGTPINMAVLNGIRALPIQNLQKTTDPDIEGITGETLPATRCCATPRVPGVRSGAFTSDMSGRGSWARTATSTGRFPTTMNRSLQLAQCST